MSNNISILLGENLNKSSSSMLYAIFLMTFILICSQGICAGEIYIYVDENGIKTITNTPISDKYKAKAKKMDSYSEKKHTASEGFARSKADYYFNKAKECVAKGGKVNTEKSSVYRSLGESCLNASGQDISNAFSYYDQTERLLESIADRCKHGPNTVNTLCVDRMIEQAVVLKRSGDAYLGKFADPQTEAIEKMEKKVKKLERKVRSYQK